MRFVPTYCLRNGMELADNLYGKSGAILLTKGTILTDAYLQGIFRLKVNGIYVEDDFSKDIEIVNIISEDLRMQSVQGVKTLFATAEDNRIANAGDMQDIEALVLSIIDELLCNQNLILNMVDIKVFDDYTYYHSVNVAVISLVMGVALELDRRELHDLCLGALLHDIGKVFIPKHILKKNGDLTEAEIEEIKKHPQTGYNYIKKTFHLPNAAVIIIMDHHERYDGEGYPEGRSAEHISLFGKIVAIADVYDALTSDRPYRKGLLPSEAIELIMGSSGTHFEPSLVSVFLRKIAPYPIGTLVRLSNGCSGIIMKNHEDFCLRPVVRILQDDDVDVEPFIVDLLFQDYSNVTIVGMA